MLKREGNQLIPWNLCWGNLLTVLVFTVTFFLLSYFFLKLKFIFTADFQDIASLFTEIASRVSDYISEHASQTMSCVNLLLQTFCETTKLLHHNDDNRGEKKGKNTNIQWTGHYVRRILFIPSVRAPMIMRVRELICTMGTTLDDAHITCLSLLLAHLVVSPVSFYVLMYFSNISLNCGRKE